MDEIGALREELDEYRHLFEIQQKRMVEATDRWRTENPDAGHWPDLGELLTWLMSEMDEARAELAANERSEDARLAVAEAELERQRENSHGND